MKNYHIFIDTDESGNPVPVLLDHEPRQWTGRRTYEGYGRIYYIYSVRRVPDGLLIEIGRAIEGKENKHP